MLTFRDMRLPVLTVFFMALAPCAKSDKVDLSEEELRRTATHIVTGEVFAIYQRAHRTGDYIVTKYVAEVRVINCEKGCGIQRIPNDFPNFKKGSLIYVRYWKRKWVGDGWPPTGTGGHRGLPNEGETFRIYLARYAYDGFTRKNLDGGFNVIGANGFEKLDVDSREEVSAVKPPSSNR